MFKKSLSLSVIICFFLTTLTPYPQAHADTLNLPAPGTMVNLSPAYQPVIIKGLTVHKDNPFLFDFIVDVGQDRMSGEPLKKEGLKLIKYFLAGLAIPDKDVWVNLSPYEKSKIIPEALSQTDMGRDLLEQDYILKQITASLIYPEKQLGKTFWDKVYAKAQQMYGTTQVPVNTFNKVWITADKAEVFEHNQTAFVVDCHLKVMLEEDYLALQKHSSPSLVKEGVRGSSEGIHSLGSQIVRQIILPQLEREVNTGKNFANLRQIFNSVLLSSWYKRNLKQALLNQVYANKSKVKGINLNDPTVKQQIYDQYLKAYKKGVFNYIKEDVNAASGETMPRKYFSGGLSEGAIGENEFTEITDLAIGSRDLAQSNTGNPAMLITTLATTQKPTNPNAAMTTEDLRNSFIIDEFIGKLQTPQAQKEPQPWLTFTSSRDAQVKWGILFQLQNEGLIFPKTLKGNLISWRVKEATTGAPKVIRRLQEMRDEAMTAEQQKLEIMSAEISRIKAIVDNGDQLTGADRSSLDKIERESAYGYVMDLPTGSGYAESLIALNKQTRRLLKKIEGKMVPEYIRVGVQRVTSVVGGRSGQVSAQEAKRVGATSVMVGHFEARLYLHDTDEEINQQIKAAIAEGITHIILAVGDLKEDMETSIEARESRVIHQLDQNLEGINLKGIDLSVAYEPTWGIRGDNFVRTPTTQDALWGRNTVRKWLDAHGISARFLYGGSVDKNTVKEFLLDGIDGFLVGSASVKPEDLVAIAEELFARGSQEGRRPLIGGNWKTYGVSATDEAYLKALFNMSSSGDVMLLPQATRIRELSLALSDLANAAMTAREDSLTQDDQQRIYNLLDTRTEYRMWWKGSSEPFRGFIRRKNEDGSIFFAGKDIRIADIFSIERLNPDLSWKFILKDGVVNAAMAAPAAAAANAAMVGVDNQKIQQLLDLDTRILAAKEGDPKRELASLVEQFNALLGAAEEHLIAEVWHIIGDNKPIGEIQELLQGLGINTDTDVFRTTWKEFTGFKNHRVAFGETVLAEWIEAAQARHDDQMRHFAIRFASLYGSNAAMATPVAAPTNAAMTASRQLQILTEIRQSLVEGKEYIGYLTTPARPWRTILSRDSMRGLSIDELRDYLTSFMKKGEFFDIGLGADNDVYFKYSREQFRFFSGQLIRKIKELANELRTISRTMSAENTRLAYRVDDKLGNVKNSYDDVFSPQVRELLPQVPGFSEKMKQILRDEVKENEALAKTGELPKFRPTHDTNNKPIINPGTNKTIEEVREGKFEGAPVPKIFQRPGDTITGPIARVVEELGKYKTIEEAKMTTAFRNIAYRKLSGAEYSLEDAEDAAGLRDTMSLDSIRYLTLAIHKDPRYLAVVEQIANDMIEKGKRPKDWDWKKLIDENYTTTIFRPRGPYKEDHHIRFVDSTGKMHTLGAEFIDILLFVVNNYKALLDQNQPIALFLPKMKSPEQAALLAEFLDWLESQLEYNGKKLNEIPLEDGKSGGIIKVVVLIEDVKAAMNIMEIRAALGRHIVMLNVARWDYMATVIKLVDYLRTFIPDDFEVMTMLYPFMQTLEKTVWRASNTPDLNGNTIIAESGMEVQVPVIPPDIKISDEEKQRLIEGFMAIAMTNKRREAMAGFTRGWVAHPDMVATVQAPFKEIYGGNKFPVLNQTHNPNGDAWERLTYTDADAHAFFAQPEKRVMTQQSVRNDISVGIQYILNALTGRGAGLIKPADYFNDPSRPFLMEDRATVEGRDSGERKKVVEEAEYTADDEADHIKAGDRLTRDRFLTTKDGEFQKLHSAPDYLIHDNVKETYLRIATMIFTKFVLAAKDDGVYLSWVADLEEVVQSLTEHGITDPVQAEKVVDRFIKDYKKSRGLVRTTINTNAIFQVDAAMRTRAKIEREMASINEQILQIGAASATHGIPHSSQNSLLRVLLDRLAELKVELQQIPSDAAMMGRWGWPRQATEPQAIVNPVTFPNSPALQKEFSAASVRKVLNAINRDYGDFGSIPVSQSILRGLISEIPTGADFQLEATNSGWILTGNSQSFAQWRSERIAQLSSDMAMAGTLENRVASYLLSTTRPFTVFDMARNMELNISDPDFTRAVSILHTWKDEGIVASTGNDNLRRWNVGNRAKLEELAKPAETQQGPSEDQAMAHATIKPQVEGGIDLNTSNGMRWKVSKDGNGVEMNVDPAMIERVRREGVDWLSPEILKMTPITSIWPLVGIQAPVPEGHLAKV